MANIERRIARTAAVALVGSGILAIIGITWDLPALKHLAQWTVVLGLSVVFVPLLVVIVVLAYQTSIARWRSRPR
jgi:hypothetical protein